MIQTETAIILKNFNPQIEEIEYKEILVINELDKWPTDLIKEALPQREYIPTKGDKIYFTPGCTVPRFKVKEFCKKYDVSIVKYKEKANTVFIGAESIQNIFDQITDYTFNRLELIKFLSVYTKLDPLIKLLKENTAQITIMSYRMYNELTDTSLKNASRLLDIVLSYNVPQPRSYIINKEVYQEFVNITSNPNLYNQDEILRKINNTIMDGESYISIQRMLKSSDINDVKLAMETMANCDYEKSCVYLLLLIKEYGEIMYNSPTRNHVNFKSLLKFFSVTNINHIDLDTIIQLLLKRKLLNKTNLDMLMPIAAAQLKDNAKTSYFKCKDVIITEEVEQGLVENILDGNCDTEIIEESQEQLNPKGMPQF